MANQADAPTERYGRRRSDVGGPLSAGRQGLAIRWATCATGLLLLAGAAWRYADARWTACEGMAADLRARVVQATEQRIVLAERSAAAVHSANERQADLQRQLAQIQTQLAQIQTDLRRSAPR